MKTLLILAAAVLIIIHACGVHAAVHLAELGFGLFVLSFTAPNGMPSFNRGA